MEKAVAALIVAAALAGCATGTARIPVSCVPPEAVAAPPAWAVEELPGDASPAELAYALWAEHLQRRAYVPQLEAIIGACAQ